MDKLLLCDFSKYSNKPLLKWFTMFGALYFSKVSLNIFYWLKKNFFTFSQNLKVKYGDGWVIITGGSDPIGYAFAEQFIIKKYKVCLISHNKNKLQNAVTSLKQKYPSAQIQFIEYDFDRIYSDKDLNEIKTLLDRFNDNICIWVNNVNTITLEKLIDSKNSEIRSMLNVNLTSITFFTRLVLDILIKREKKSLIIGCSSIADSFRFTKNSILGGTKAYLECFLEIINRDYHDKIDYTCFEIGPVINDMKNSHCLFTIPAEKWAKSSMRLLGRYSKTTGHIYHDFMRLMFWKIPLFVSDIIRNKCNTQVFRTEIDSLKEGEKEEIINTNEISE